MDRFDRISGVKNSPEEILRKYESNLSEEMRLHIQNILRAERKCEYLRDHRKEICFCGIGIQEPKLPTPDDVLPVSHLTKYCTGNYEICCMFPRKYKKAS